MTGRYFDPCLIYLLLFLYSMACSSCGSKELVVDNYQHICNDCGTVQGKSRLNITTASPCFVDEYTSY